MKEEQPQQRLKGQPFDELDGNIQGFAPRWSSRTALLEDLALGYTPPLDHRIPAPVRCR